MFQQLALMLMLAAAPVARQDTSAVDDHERARSLVGALRVYDSTVQSLEWRSVTFQPGFEPGGGWMPSEFMTAGFDDAGRWYMQNQYATTPAAGSQDVPDFSVEFRSIQDDPSRMLYFTLVQRDGKVAGPVQPPFIFSVTPLNTLGRRSDLEQGRTLAELLETGDDLKLWSSPDHPGLPGVQAMATHGQYRFRVQVVLDPAHGYAPRMFRTYRPDTGTPMESVEAVRYAEIDKIWIASVSLRTTYLFIDAAPGSTKAANFQKHKERLGVLPRFLGVNIPEDLRNELAAVLPRLMDDGPVPGQPDQFYAPMGAGMAKGAYTPLLHFVTPRSINKPLDQDWLSGPMRQDDTVFDFTRNRRCTITEAVPPPAMKKEASE